MPPRVFISYSHDTPEHRVDIQGVPLNRDPHGIAAGVLTVELPGESRPPIAEFVSEAGSEWLSSVGNAVMRYY